MSPDTLPNMEHLSTELSLFWSNESCLSTIPRQCLMVISTVAQTCLFPSQSVQPRGRDRAGELVVLPSRREQCWCPDRGCPERPRPQMTVACGRGIEGKNSTEPDPSVMHAHRHTHAHTAHSHTCTCACTCTFACTCMLSNMCTHIHTCTAHLCTLMHMVLLHMCIILHT